MAASSQTSRPPTPTARLRHGCSGMVPARPRRPSAITSGERLRPRAERRGRPPSALSQGQRGRGPRRTRRPLSGSPLRRRGPFSCVPARPPGGSLRRRRRSHPFRCGQARPPLSTLATARSHTRRRSASRRSRVAPRSRLRRSRPRTVLLRFLYFGQLRLRCRCRYPIHSCHTHPAEPPAALRTSCDTPLRLKTNRRPGSRPSGACWGGPLCCSARRQRRSADQNEREGDSKH